MEIVNGKATRIIIGILFSVLMLFIGKLWGDGTVAADLSAHVSQPGHPVTLERVQSVEERTQERYNTIINRLNRLQSSVEELRRDRQ